MFLFEEYFNRHQISDVPLVRHCEKGSLILRTSDFNYWKEKWGILKIDWEDHDHHPGQYLISIEFPIHDGYLSNSMFNQLPPVRKKWHEYENYFIEWSKTLSCVSCPVSDEIDVSLTAWEMFVYVYDGWFSKQSFEMKDILFESLDCERSHDDRYKKYQETVLLLSKNNPNILKSWKYDFLFRLKNYSNWLAVLVNQCKIKNH